MNENENKNETPAEECARLIKEMSNTELAEKIHQALRSGLSHKAVLILVGELMRRLYE